jgi:uncharacterized membrane protein (DUF485 family)
MRYDANQPPQHAADPPLFAELQALPDVRELRAARRGPVLRAAGSVLGLYVLNALLANEARGLMALPLPGVVNVGLALGLLQCGAAIWATQWYVRYARTEIDPLGVHVCRAFEQREGEL